MRMKILLVILAGLALAACNKGNNAADDNALDGAFSGIGGNGAAVAPLAPPPPPMPAPIAVNPVPQPLPIPQAPPAPILNQPISPTPQFVQGSQEALRAEAGDRVFFNTNSVTLDSRAQAILRGVSGWLAQNPGRTLVIEGHADERGTREYNLALGERRSSAVRSFLAGQGVPSSRFETVSFGKERPMAPGSNPRSWALNRRAVFIVR